jgi:PAS domain S-box-containing protein
MGKDSIKKKREAVKDIAELKKAGEKLKKSALYLDSISDALLVGNPDTIITRVNVATLKLWGYSSEEIIGRSVLELFPEAEVPKHKAEMEKAIKTVRVIQFETVALTKKGKQIPVELRGNAITDDQGNVSELIAVINDITERKKAEEVLRESDLKHRTLVHNIPGMVYRGYPDWSAEIISRSEEISGYTNAELNSKEENWLSILHPDDKEKVLREGSELTTGSKSLVQIYRIITKEGNVRWVEDHKISLFSPEGEFKGIDGIVLDITERKKAEEALKESEIRLKTFLNSATEAFSLWNSELNLVLCNDLAKKTLQVGDNKIDPIGKNIQELVPDVKKSGRFDQYLSVLKTGKPLHIDDIDAHFKFGDMRFSLKAFNVGGGIGMIVADITERKTTEKALRESEKRYRGLFDSSLDGVFYSDEKGKFTSVNQAMAELLGHKSPDEMIGRPAIDYWADPKDRDAYISILKHKKSVSTYSIRTKRNDGSEHYSEVTSKIREDDEGNFQGIEGTLRDVTERKVAQEKLQEKIDELEKWQRLTVDREIKMIELKKDIHKLKKKLKKYKSV